MEQLVIFILFVVVSIVSSILQQRKKAQEEEEIRRNLPPAGPDRDLLEPRRTRPVITRWPGNLDELQEQVKRMLQENAPPVIRPVVVPERRQSPARPPTSPPLVVSPAELSEGDVTFKSPFLESSSAHERVSNLQERIQARLRAASEQTTTHRAAVSVRASRRPSSPFVRRLRRDSGALREAFVASLIFSAPKSLETSDLFQTHH